MSELKPHEIVQSRIGEVGIGQGGGNLAKTLMSQGFDAIFFNTSNNDLTSTLMKDVPKDLKLHFPNTIGCNQDTEKALDILDEHFDLIFPYLSNLRSKELIFVNASLGGGTGVGMALAMGDAIIMEYPNIRVGYNFILPHFHDGKTAWFNAIKALNQLIENDNYKKYGAIFLLDNNCLADNSPSNLLSLNNQFVYRFLETCKIPNYKTDTNNCDESDLLDMLKISGIAYNDTILENSTSELIAHSITNNIYAPFERESRPIRAVISTHDKPDEKAFIDTFGRPTINLKANKREDIGASFLQVGHAFPQNRMAEMAKWYKEAGMHSVKNKIISLEADEDLFATRNIATTTHINSNDISEEELKRAKREKMRESLRESRRR
jgi:replicative DNA helicase